MGLAALVSLHSLLDDVASTTQMFIRCGIVLGAVIALAIASSPFGSSLSADTEVRELSFDGHTREYLLSAPASGGRLPTIVALHGTLLNAQRTRLSMGFEPLVDREGLVVVYPNAVAGQWNDGRSAAAALTMEVDDVAFVRSLIEHLVDSGISDPHRIYVSGFSNGGMMAFRLICEAPELIAAAAAIAATLPVELAAGCPAPGPTPVLVMNGTADPIVPYAGGALAFGGGNVLSTDETVGFLRTLNRCADGAKLGAVPDIDPGDGSRVTVGRWTNCASAAPVVLYRIQGGGHRIPGHFEDWPITDILLGRMNHDFEAAYAIWSFFKDKKR